MVRFLMHFVVVALGLAAATKIVPGVQVDSLTTLLIAALVLGFVNAVIRPILTFLTLPITCLTLGLFYLVVNGLAFTLAAYVVPGFHVESFGIRHPGSPGGQRRLMVHRPVRRRPQEIVSGTP